MKSREEIRAALTGPFTSINTPFLRDGSIDYDGLRNMLDFNIAAGSKTILLTAGDSHLIILSRQEVAEVTKATVEHTAGRAMVVAANRQFDTRSAVEFAKYSHEIGADVVMVQPSDWAGSCTAETMVEHYAAVARIMPVMVVTNVFAGHGAEFGLKTCKLAMEKVDNVVAVKDDVCGDFARRLTLLVRDKWAVFSGGLKVNHMDMWPYGCDGYMSTYMCFKPEIAWRYWQAILAKDVLAATAVIRDYDMPFFDHIMKLPGGFDAGTHGTLELFGICKRWRRPPHYSLNDREMEGLRGLFNALKLL